MNYGYGQMWTLTFVPVGFVIVIASSMAYCLVYAVGASRGAVAAQVYLRFCDRALAVASACTIVYAVASGQATTFLAWYGVGPLVEMAVLGIMCVGSLWFMASVYVRGKVCDEAMRKATSDA
ncbi:MAG: hypothetical protein U1E26_10870 [Coriobacteriia bacterium]|nr:hypothetical protein [Coriobacteriia bacterium]